MVEPEVFRLFASRRREHLAAQTLLWSREDELGLEHLHYTAQDSGCEADGVVIGQHDGQPFRLTYVIAADHATGELILRATCLYGASMPTEYALGLRRDPDGSWQVTAPDEFDSGALAGCRTIDIAATPFTNTLAVKALNLASGASAEIAIAYISVLDLIPRPVMQRYTCLEQTATGSRYRYEGLDTGYTNEIPFDIVGLVVDYPGIWRRVG
jgi:hypothetical protein